GFGIVSIGAVIHALLTAKAALRRLMRRRPKASPAAAGSGAPRAAWSGLMADDGGLTSPAAYAPRSKAGSTSAGQAGADAQSSRVAEPAGPLKPGARAAADAQLK